MLPLSKCENTFENVPYAVIGGGSLFPLHHYLESDNSSKHNISEALGDLIFKLLSEYSMWNIWCICLMSLKFSSSGCHLSCRSNYKFFNKK